MSHRNRKQLQDLGLWDDKLESELLAILNKKDEDLELERVKVSAREDVLQNQLMEARVR